MRIRSRQALFALMLALALAAGCRSPESVRPPLRIGVVEDNPPFVFRDRGRWSGLEAELGRALADRLAMKPVFVACSLDGLAPALLEGKVDVLMAGLAVTGERRVQLDFASPYLVVGQAALVRTADLPRYNTAIKIRATRERVGVQAGAAGDQLVSRYFPEASCARFPGPGEAIEALRAGRIDMVVADAPALWWRSLQYPGRLAVAPALFAREEIAWAFRRGSVFLRESANRALADWQQDGTLETILQRWIPCSQ